MATGKYLYLMDSDDILKVETALEDTYKIAEEKNLDFVLFQSINYYMDTNKLIKKENYSMNKLADFIGDKVFSWEDIKDYIFTITVTPWSKLYNREFIVNCGAKFPKALFLKITYSSGKFFSALKEFISTDNIISYAAGIHHHLQFPEDLNSRIQLM